MPPCDESHMEAYLHEDPALNLVTLMYKWRDNQVRNLPPFHSHFAHNSSCAGQHPVSNWCPQIRALEITHQKCGAVIVHQLEIGFGQGGGCVDGSWDIVWVWVVGCVFVVERGAGC